MKNNINLREAKCCSNCRFGLPGGNRSEDYYNLYCTKINDDISGNMICDYYE